MSNGSEDLGNIGGRVSALEANRTNDSERLERIEILAASMKTTLDQMDGGKKALMTLFAIIGVVPAFLVWCVDHIKLH